MIREAQGTCRSSVEKSHPGFHDLRSSLAIILGVKTEPRASWSEKLGTCRRTIVVLLCEKLQPSFHERRSLLASLLDIKTDYELHGLRSLAHVDLLCEKLQPSFSWPEKLACESSQYKELNHSSHDQRSLAHVVLLCAKPQPSFHVHRSLLASLLSINTES